MAKQAEIKHLKLKPEGNYNYNSEILLSTLSYKKLPKAIIRKYSQLACRKRMGRTIKAIPGLPVKECQRHRWIQNKQQPVIHG